MEVCSEHRQEVQEAIQIIFDSLDKNNIQTSIGLSALLNALSFSSILAGIEYEEFMGMCERSYKIVKMNKEI